MKSEHRHELKTNELAEWIANLPQWARENGRMVIYISVVAVLVIGSGLWYWRKVTAETAQQQLDLTNLVARLSQNKLQVLMSQQSGNDTSVSLIMAAEELGTFAGGAKDENISALALIKQAEAQRASVHYRQQTVNQTELQRAINEVKSVYNRALEKAANNPSLTAMARFGLGLCEEELGNFDMARQIYSDIVANGDFEGTTVVAKAKQRLGTMADYERRIVFKTMPKPKQPPADVFQPPTDLFDTPIPLRPPEDNIAIEGPNGVIILPDVNIGPEPNRAPRPLNINIQPPAPNTVLEIADINVPGE
jgi:predicted negative regulator of RcsB-dependent stress response